MKKVLKTSPTNTSLNKNSFHVRCTPQIVGHNFFLMKCEVVDNRSCFPILKKYVIIVCRAIINNHVPCWFYSIPVLISAVGILFLNKSSAWLYYWEKQPNHKAICAWLLCLIFDNWSSTLQIMMLVFSIFWNHITFQKQMIP